jgi:hypothetical protein
MIITALSLAAAALLAVAGVAKLRTPGPAATMIVTTWPRVRPWRRARLVARTAGVAEVCCGGAVLLVGGRVPPALLLACYLVLSAVALRLALGAENASCGCFGNADGAVGIPHVLLDLCGVGIAAAALARPPGPVSTVFADGALRGLIVCAQASLLAALGYLSITALPALAAARRPLESS